jgi:membrane-anchored protein YejM (alkaline phosphatase superfamily)
MRSRALLDAPLPPAADPRERHRGALLALALGNTATALVHALGYLRAAPDGAAGRGLLALALAAQLAAAFFVAALLLRPLARAASGRALLLGAAPLLFTALHLFFFVDRKLYATLGMHLNTLVLDLALAQGGLRALDASAGEWTGLALRWVGVLALEAASFAWLVRRGPGAAPGPRGWLRAGAAIVVLLATERVVYAATTLARGEVGPAAAAAPAHALERLFRLRVAAPAPLRYPRAPLELPPGGPRPNLVWIVVESWRRDALGPQLTPALWRQSRRSLTFRNHVSGGNNSMIGVYSQFFGLHGSAVPALQRSEQRPVLFRALKDLGYRVEVDVSQAIEYGQMRDTIFADVVSAPAFGGGTPPERDRAAASRAAAFLRTARRGEPFALVILLDGTHLPYHFDAARARHRPFDEDLRYGDLDRPHSPSLLRNRYLNALAEVDESAGTVLEALEATGLAGETITVVTGDHGEQLLEHGRIGHLVSLSPEETGTPLLLRVPGVAPAERTDLSRHADLPPTILGLLGARNPPADYSVGRSLLRDPPPEFAILVGMMQSGVRTADGWTVEWDTGDEALQARSGYRVLDPEYREQPGANPPHPEAVTAALADLQRFTR